MLYDLTIIIPIYNAQLTIELLIDSIHAALSARTIRYHIILVDDNSRDESATIIRQLADTDPCITGIMLGINSGQQEALRCGLNHARNSSHIMFMDDDLQHPPELIPLLYDAISHDFDLVYAIPKNKERNKTRRFGSLLRDILFRTILKTPNGIKVSSFCIMKKHLADQVRKQKRNFYYFSASAFQHKIKVNNIAYTRIDRKHGESGYTLRKLMHLYLNILREYTALKHIVPASKHNRLYQIDHVTKNCNRKKRLMLLGGANTQLNAIKQTRRLGYEILLADYLPTPPGAHYADFHIQISTFDPISCSAVAKQYDVDGVLTVATDQPVYTAAYVAEKLDLPCSINTDIAFLVTNKKAMKACLNEHNLPTANYRLIKKSDNIIELLSELKSPFVMKPLDSQGQRGIFKVGHAESIIELIDETLVHSRENEILVEEYYPSDEITVSCWVNEQHVTILSLTDRLHVEDSVHIGICNAHRFPSIYMNRYSEISDLTEQISKAFGIKNGPLYIQMFVGADGIKINELACRIGGAFEDVFIPYITNFDILKENIDLAIGKKTQCPIASFDLTKTDKQVSVQLLFCRSGTVSSITPLKQILSLPYVIDAGYNFKEGDHIPNTENATARFGHAVITSNDGKIEENIQDFFNQLEVLDEHGNHMLIKNIL